MRNPATAAPLPHHVAALDGIKASIEAEKRAERERLDVRPPTADDELLRIARQYGAHEAAEYLRQCGRGAFSAAALSELRELTA